MIRRSTALVAAAAAAAAPAVAVLAPQSAAPKASDQSINSSARIVTPTWKTFSTTLGRGTKIVVSKGGNITGFASPLQGGTYEHIGVGAIGEGYVVCYSGANAYDLGQTSSGFGAPSATSTKIVRSTTDGKVQLTQTFKLVPENNTTPTVFLVTMMVKNTSGAPLSNVVVRRQVDFDIDTGGTKGWAGFVSNHSRTRATVSAFHDPAEAPAGTESHGIMMHVGQSSGSPWYTRVTSDILPSDCDPASASLDANFISRGDYGDTIGWTMGNLAAGASKTVSVRYVRF